MTRSFGLMSFVRPMLFIACLTIHGSHLRGEERLEASEEAAFLSNVRQLTFEGRRAGEGYFSRDGKRMVFQSERAADNPFFQIYLLDLETGDTERISPGIGKTTCAWIHPDGNKIVYASTEDDPEAVAKQKAELEVRASGKERRYSWDYDETFELYCHDLETGQTTELTRAKGYDAEGSYSPDGKLIAFASNRHAYGQSLSPEERKIFETDKSYFNEIYIMHSDGTNVRRLTNTPGYDGGPFFSPDGSRICFRRFSEDGALAEIMTMKIDGTDEKQLTRMGAMSWAPFYHPSGEYLIFTTNKHGFANFELYVVDVEAKSPPLRITHTDGFDGLPVFTPNGAQLAWTTNRNASKQSQIFIADWNHQEVRTRLGSRGVTSGELADAEGSDASMADSVAEASEAATAAARQSSADFQAEDLLRHVDYLCRPELEGRLTGTAGEMLATAYVAAYMQGLGLEPAGDDGTWFQPFEFTSGISFGENNSMRVVMGGETPTRLELTKDWQPVAFSNEGKIKPSEVVFAGYGIQAPADEEAEPPQAEYDSFVHLDVNGKWVIVFRFMPEGISAERRQHLARYASLRFKAMKLRDLGAAGMIVVSGPQSKVKSELVPLRFDGSLAGSSIPVLSLRDSVVAEWMQAGDKNLGELQRTLDEGEPAMGFTMPGIQVAANIDLTTETKMGRNVLGRLAVAEEPTPESIIIGAHVDHLGRGTGGSLAKEDEVNQIHFGADDNASGVAAMLEIAQYLAHQQKSGKLRGQRDILFAAWSGEELGLLGASHFVEAYAAAIPGHTVAHAAEMAEASHGAHDETETRESTHSIYPHIAACLNLDMVGRFEKRLVLQGVGSSNYWKGEIERRNAPIGLPITIQNDSYLPTDASAFFMRGVPILAAFTGSHSEYHTPRDTPEKLNYEDAARIAKFIGLVARGLTQADAAPDYVSQARPEEERPRAGLRAYLGTIPDYAQSDVSGVKLSGVAKEGPAAQAGVRGGDVIVELAGKKIENIYDYTYAIDAVKIGQPTKIIVQRGEERITLELTPSSRE